MDVLLISLTAALDDTGYGSGGGGTGICMYGSPSVFCGALVMGLYDT